MGTKPSGISMTVLARRLFLALLAVLTLATPALAAGRALVILVSIDGFRADYAKRGLTPTLAALAAEGAWAPEGMAPSFPVNTFPNHSTPSPGTPALPPPQAGAPATTSMAAARRGGRSGMAPGPGGASGVVSVQAV